MARFSKPLRRSRRRRLIAGVCGGIAERLGWPAAVVRTLFVVGSIVPVLPGFLVYLVLWLVVPQEEHHRRRAADRDTETTPRLPLGALRAPRRR